MRPVEFADHLKILDVPLGTFDAQQHRQEIALAFGLSRRLIGGTMLDLDSIHHRIADAFTPTLSRKMSAAVINAHSDQVLQAIGLADAEPDEEMFLAAVELGGWGPIPPGTDRQMIFGATTLPAFVESYAKNAKAKRATRMTIISVTKILREVRARAAKLGFDWRGPFFPPPDNPMAAKLIKAAKKERELALQIYAEAQFAKHPAPTEVRQ